MKKMINNFMHYRYFLRENVVKTIKLKYRSSYLGIVWTLVEPFLTMLVLTFVFGTLFGRDDPAFPVYILSGRLLYSYFASATRGCVKSVRANAGMIKKVYVPKYIYPLSSILSNFIIFLVSLIVLVGVSLYYKIYPTLYTLEAIVPLAVLLLLSFGIGMILATVGVYFRDMEYLWSVALMLVMYTCAIFYKVERFEKNDLVWVLNINPLYCIIKNFRNCVVYATHLEFSTMMYAFGVALVTTIVGLVVFSRKQDEFILHI